MGAESTQRRDPPVGPGDVNPPTTGYPTAITVYADSQPVLEVGFLKPGFRPSKVYVLKDGERRETDRWEWDGDTLWVNTGKVAIGASFDGFLVSTGPAHD